jgi:hypothetical protein
MVTLDMLTLNEAGKRIVYMDARRQKFGNVPRCFPADARLFDDLRAHWRPCPMPPRPVMMRQRHVP